MRTKPDAYWFLGSTVLSLSVHPEQNCAVATVEYGTVELLAFDPDDKRGHGASRRRPVCSFSPPFDSNARRSSNVYPASACIVPSKDQWSYSIAVGGSDGSLYLQPLRMRQSTGNAPDIDMEDPIRGVTGLYSLGPRHFGPVKCLASPAPGLLLTGGLDGTLRVWDVDAKQHLYQFRGYKVWLGSLWTDGVRIVSDGSDNTVIMHDFSVEALQPKQKDDDDKN
jgi:WD40 repeat protein